jgi:hypothetical protein
MVRPRVCALRQKNFTNHPNGQGALCAHVDLGLNLTPRCNVHGAQVVTRQYLGPALRATGTPARTPGAPH